MCGIFGVWNYRTSAPVDRALLRRATNALVHRGPDDSGHHVDDVRGLGLGFRRLSIIDLSPAGHQPMTNEDGSVWIVFNGEIYNFQEIRPRLERLGHAFRSRTDTEVVLHLYEERGAEAVLELEGMFAFAIWDAGRQTLLLARDRTGKKPLYYHDDGRRLIFASELKAILVDPSVSRAIDPGALRQYLTLGYVVSPATIFSAVRKLPPACTMMHEAGRAAVRRYWDLLPAFRRSESKVSEDEWGDRIRAHLRDAVRKRLMSDVPLGAFLSGGVDSSAVVAMMAMLAKESPGPVRTFSIGFHEPRFNELPYARAVAARFRTEHHELFIEPESVADLLPRLARQYDEPFGDSSALPTYYLCRLARSQVTVCLSGDGGDEACAGYDRYQQGLRESSIDRVPLALRRLAHSSFSLLPSAVPGRRRVRRLALAAEARYAEMMRQIPPDRLDDLLAAGAEASDGDGAQPVLAALEECEDLDPLSRMQYADVRVYLPEDILVKVDRASMLNSLEVRCPLLDVHFLELMASVPASVRAPGGRGKALFKSALRGIVPDEVLDRPKMGFGVPLELWFRDDLGAFVREILLDPRTLARGMFERGGLDRLIEAQARDRPDLTPALWVVLMLELWCREHLDRT